jgi:flagellar hook protein FlgE
MSLYGIMRTSTSGMSAQADRLATVADNIANVNTNGYKRASCEFSSLLIQSCPTASGYTSGSVIADNRNAISEQGSFINTASTTDLAVQGDGFFVVSDAVGSPYLSRAGSFVKDDNGALVNAGGFKLLGYPLTNGQPSIAVNGFSGLVPVSIGDLALTAKASANGQFTANVPSNATVVPAASLPSTNSAAAQFTGKSSLITYDNLGNRVLVDMYFSKTASNTWEVTAYDQATATAGGFPYGSPALSSSTLTFNGTTGALAATSPASISIPIPNGVAMSLDMSKMSQLATDYTVISATADGNPPSGVNLLEISKDGTLMATFGNGTRVSVFRIPLATVTSPDNMSSLTGNVFSATKESGNVKIGFPETANFGSVLSNTLEQSNVDLATELTSMIDSQRGYSANSKVFQTGSELMDVLINLKR